MSLSIPSENSSSGPPASLPIMVPAASHSMAQSSAISGSRKSTYPPKMKFQPSSFEPNPEDTLRGTPAKEPFLSAMNLRLPPHAFDADKQIDAPLSPCTPMIDQIRLNNYSFPSIDCSPAGPQATPSKTNALSPLRSMLSLDGTESPSDEETADIQTTVIKYGLPSPSIGALILPKIKKKSSRSKFQFQAVRGKSSRSALSAFELDTPPLTPPSVSSNIDNDAHESQKIEPSEAMHLGEGALGLQLFSPPTPKAQHVDRLGQIPVQTTELPTKSACHLKNHPVHPTIDKYYTLGDELGSGGFGFVVAATYRHPKLSAETGDMISNVAIKFIFKSKVPAHGWAKDPVMGTIPMEAFVLRMIKHTGVVKFVDMFEDDTFWCLVMELHGSTWSTTMTVTNAAAKESSLTHSLIKHSAQHPQSRRESVPNLGIPSQMVRRSSMDLFECIETHERFSETQARYIFAQVVEVVHYLDGLGIVHRDLKDENIVVDKNLKVKLIDFGSAVLHNPRKEPPYYTKFYGTITFAASEILQGHAYQAPKAEVWSLGCLLSILVCGEAPFSEPARAVNGQISRPRVALSRDCWDLMLRCLEVSPERRATIQEIKEHPWITKAAGLKLNV